MRKIKKDDEVILIAGKNKGHKGKVMQVLSGAASRVSDKVLVEGANLLKKHRKPNPQKNDKGGIVSQEAPIDISNVAIYNSATDKPDRVGIKLQDGKKVRFYKSTGELVDS